jgi:anti-sigma B factor antagonist
MLLKTELRLTGGVAVVDASGRLVYAPPEEGLRDRLSRIFDDGCPFILLNLEAIEMADSSGLGDLIAAYASILRRGGVVKLLHPSGRLAKVLQHTHIDALFEVYEDEESALASFKSAKSPQSDKSLTEFLNNPPTA